MGPPAWQRIITQICNPHSLFRMRVGDVIIIRNIWGMESPFKETPKISALAKRLLPLPLTRKNFLRIKESRPPSPCFVPYPLGLDFNFVRLLLSFSHISTSQFSFSFLTASPYNNDDIYSNYEDEPRKENIIHSIPR